MRYLIKPRVRDCWRTLGVIFTKTQAEAERIAAEKGEGASVQPCTGKRGTIGFGWKFVVQKSGRRS